MQFEKGESFHKDAGLTEDTPRIYSPKAIQEKQGVFIKDSARDSRRE